MSPLEEGLFVKVENGEVWGFRDIIVLNNIKNRDTPTSSQIG